jgi:peptidoglycan/LPS O-acetylase OafA/YrhL
MSDNNSNKKRNTIIDLLRIILAVLVVNFHVIIISGSKVNFLQPYTLYAVPLFIILSFFFFSKKPLVVRIKRLYVPLVFWSIIGFAIQPDLINTKNIFLQLLTGQIVNTSLYYLILLTWFTVIYFLIDLLPSGLRVSIYFWIILVALFLEYSSINYNFFIPLDQAIFYCYGRFVELIIYVPIGLAFAFLKKKISNNNLFLVLLIIFLPIYVVSSSIPQPLGFYYSGLKTLAGSIIIFSLALGLSNFKFSSKVNCVINFLGKYSFGVYLSHILLLEIILKIDPALKLFIALYQIPFLLFYVAGCYLFCFLFDILTLKKLSFLVK